MCIESPHWQCRTAESVSGSVLILILCIEPAGSILCPSTGHFITSGFSFPIAKIIRSISSSKCLSESASSVQFSWSVVSDSLWPHGLQHARPPCPSPTPGVYSNSCPLSWWCHPTISPSVVPFSSCPQSFQASGSFPMSQFFASGGQNIRVSVSILPMNPQDWSP